MKLVVIFLVNFFASLSVYAGLQWVPYSPQGDYGGMVLVAGFEFLDNEGKREEFYGICKTIDGRGEIRVGTVDNNLCNYVNDSIIMSVISTRRMEYNYRLATSKNFEVLVAQSHHDYFWANFGADYKDVNDFATPFDALHSIYVCRHKYKGLRKTIFYLGQYREKKGLLTNRCYYAYFSDGREGLAHQILVENTVL